MLRLVTFKPITLNNLLRARVESGLSGLRLQAPDHCRPRKSDQRACSKRRIQRPNR